MGSNHGPERLRGVEWMGSNLKNTDVRVVFHFGSGNVTKKDFTHSF